MEYKVEGGQGCSSLLYGQARIHNAGQLKPIFMPQSILGPQRETEEFLLLVC